ncbi:MAG: iron ABC transporter permease [Synergistetes bacterium]|nr:MAG: Transport system permease protein [bacterium 42_11]MBC7332350.1 iron ABC transporter permease [Synergistota bacterium]MDK2871997.1 cobalamin transport system permease protein [bacterium]
MTVKRILLLCLFIFFLLFSIYEGPTSISLKDILQGSPIFWKVRLPRVIHAFIVGASLSLSGSTLQAILRNPLAEPYLLGISAGAAVGAVLGVMLGVDWGIELSSFAGAILSFFIVYQLSFYNGFLSSERLLLSGIAVNSFLSAFLGFLLYFMGQGIHGILFWLWGGFGLSSWSSVIRILPFFTLFSLLIIRYASELNIILWGEEHAEQMGVDFNRLVKLLVIVSSLLAAFSVASSGIIGFVGLIVPHMVRMVISPDHRKLLPFSILLGGGFLAFADALSRILLSPIEIPVGIITALCGSPIFIYLLRGKVKNSA